MTQNANYAENIVHGARDGQKCNGETPSDKKTDKHESVAPNEHFKAITRNVARMMASTHCVLTNVRRCVGTTRLHILQ